VKSFSIKYAYKIHLVHTENLTRIHYKYQPLDAAQGNHCSVLSDIIRYTNTVQCVGTAQLVKVKAILTHT
jgi:hypothetical protein